MWTVAACQGFAGGRLGWRSLTELIAELFQELLDQTRSLWATPMAHTRSSTHSTHATRADHSLSLGILCFFGLLVPKLAIGKVSLRLQIVWRLALGLV